jgi:hypothetical protein
VFADRAVGVVEGHRDRLPARAREDGVAERGPAIAAVEQVVQVALQALGGDGTRRRPGVTDPVVTENEGVRERRNRSSG